MYSVRFLNKAGTLKNHLFKMPHNEGFVVIMNELNYTINIKYTFLEKNSLYVESSYTRDGIVIKSYISQLSGDEYDEWIKFLSV